MSTDSSTAVHQAARAPSEWRTSGLIQLTRPQTIGTLSGLMLSMLLAALDQTIVGRRSQRSSPRSPALIVIPGSQRLTCYVLRSPSRYSQSYRISTEENGSCSAVLPVSF